MSYNRDVRNSDTIGTGLTGTLKYSRSEMSYGGSIQTNVYQRHDYITRLEKARDAGTYPEIIRNLSLKIGVQASGCMTQSLRAFCLRSSQSAFETSQSSN
jgi:hypothetical protein